MSCSTLHNYWLAFCHGHVTEREFWELVLRYVLAEHGPDAEAVPFLLVKAGGLRKPADGGNWLGEGGSVVAKSRPVMSPGGRSVHCGDITAWSGKIATR